MRSDSHSPTGARVNRSDSGEETTDDEGCGGLEEKTLTKIIETYAEHSERSNDDRAND